MNSTTSVELPLSVNKGRYIFVSERLPSSAGNLLLSTHDPREGADGRACWSKEHQSGSRRAALPDWKFPARRHLLWSGPDLRLPRYHRYTSRDRTLYHG